MAYTKFRFRAECEADVLALDAIIEAEAVPYALRMWGVTMDHATLGIVEMPDRECRLYIRSDFNIERLRECMRRVPDGHVMMQTVAPEEQYTGQRDYSLA